MSVSILRHERHALVEVCRRPLLFGVALAGNALLFGMVYGWLSLPERNVWQVGASALLAALIACVAVWLNATALASFQSEARGLPFRPVLARLPRLMAWFAVLAAVYAVLGWLRGYAPAAGAHLSALLTWALRTPIAPAKAAWAYRALLALLHVVAWLVLLPPACRTLQRAAPAGVVKAVLRRWRYWLGAVLISGVGYYVPRLLVNWVPPVEGIPLETASMLVRFALAYVLAMTGWLTLLAFVSNFFGQAALQPE